MQRWVLRVAARHPGRNTRLPPTPGYLGRGKKRHAWTRSIHSVNRNIYTVFLSLLKGLQMRAYLTFEFGVTGTTDVRVTMTSRACFESPAQQLQRCWTIRASPSCPSIYSGLMFASSQRVFMAATVALASAQFVWIFTKDTKCHTEFAILHRDQPSSTRHIPGSGTPRL